MWMNEKGGCHGEYKGFAVVMDLYGKAQCRVAILEHCQTVLREAG